MKSSGIYIILRVMLYENVNRAALYKLHVTGAAATRSINVIASDANNGVTHQTWKKEKETEINKTWRERYLHVSRGDENTHGIVCKQLLYFAGFKITMKLYAR